MFSLVYGFYEYVFRKEEIRILMLGLDKSGKTTLLERLKGLFGEGPGLDPDNILPTVGLNVGRLEAFKAQLMVWDLGGQPGLRSIWDKYYGDSHGLLFVVDATEPQRYWKPY
jgi:ADP-ribosylation factor related protein 1